MVVLNTVLSAAALARDYELVCGDYDHSVYWLPVYRPKTIDFKLILNTSGWF